VGVAKMIAKGDPPAWLPKALADFARFVSLDKPTYDVEIERKMLAAAEYLEEWVPIVYGDWDELDLEAPDWIDQFHNALHELIEMLRKDCEQTRRGGPKPDSRRLLCAAAVGECYRTLHGKLEPGSTLLRDACNEFWKACKNPEIGEGDPGNWRRHLESHVAKSADPWARDIIDLYITGRK